MNKPISKHALRRAVDKMVDQGHLVPNEPLGTLVDRMWHELEKGSFNGNRKKPISRDTVRTAEAPELG